MMKISEIKGVGQSLEKSLASLGIKTVSDALNYYPRRYEDYSTITTISRLSPGAVTVKAKVEQVHGRYIRRGMHITEAVVSDDTGSLRVTWFNQPYRAKALKQGDDYYFSGTYELSYRQLRLMNPSVEQVSDFTLNTARIVPVYRENKSISSKQIRKVIAGCLTEIDKCDENIPEWIIHKYDLISKKDAIRAVHYPHSTEELEASQRRLGFEEVFSLVLASLLNKKQNALEHSVSVKFDQSLAKDFVSKLPFQLTNDQRRSVWQIYTDMQRDIPMNRLVEGDVGSGKTVVAAMAALMAIRHGYQVALMAPTEILAKQHAATLYNLLQPLNMESCIGLLTGSLSKANKLELHKKIADGTVRFIVGTHAIIQDNVDIHNLGLVIIDEQHRFGVEQRKKLMAKSGHMPHVLTLTATPIPRSLALTLYGELDISLLKEKPKGRLPILTEIIRSERRNEIYEILVAKINSGEQLYIVCPLIESSSDETVRFHSVEEVYDEVKNKYFNSHTVGLLHGKMKSDEKQAVMQRFSSGEIMVLVATTVIEVGIDVPNATNIVIESAERFGLAQLHQLRGRVGRGDRQSLAYLILSDGIEPTKRLHAVASSNDGFKLAEYDLTLRGAGAIYGSVQHGALDLRMAKLTDTKLLVEAATAAKEFIEKNEKMLEYPELEVRVNYLRRVTNLN